MGWDGMGWDGMDTQRNTATQSPPTPTAWPWGGLSPQCSWERGCGSGARQWGGAGCDSAARGPLGVPHPTLLCAWMAPQHEGEQTGSG